MKPLLKAAIAALALCASLAAKAQNESLTYTNPVLRANAADPTVIDDRARTGWFYLYTTQTSLDGVDKASRAIVEGSKEINLPIYRSRNLVDWEFVGDGFPDGRPSWVENSALWAPDINYIDGKYVLYYALGVWGGIFVEGCGVAVSDSPMGPFVDEGMIVDFKSARAMNSIDPDFFEDNGKRYLYWGSLGGGVYGIELSADAKRTDILADKHRITARNTEAAYMYKRGNWYYMFSSRGKCCEGEKSTYHVIVGRADNPMGPFVGPDGQRMATFNFRNVFLSSDSGFVGPGHNGEILTDDAGQDWIIYHSYWKGNGYNGRCLMLDRVFWTEDGWPYIIDSKPSATAPVPCFK